MRLPDNPRDGKETRVAYKESQELILRDPSKREKRTPIPIAAHLTIAIGFNVGLHRSRCNVEGFRVYSVVA